MLTVPWGLFKLATRVIVAIVVVVSLSVVMVSSSVSMVVFLGMGSAAIGSQEGRRSFLFNHALGQPPQNNTDSALAILFRRGKRIDAVLPQNIGVAAKGKDAIVGLRKVEADLFFVFERLGTDEGQFSSGTKTDSHSNVLILRPLWVEGRAVVMEGFPVGTVCRELDKH